MIINFANQTFTVLFVDSTRPDDTGDGLTAATAKKILPAPSTWSGPTIFLFRRNTAAGAYTNDYTIQPGSTNHAYLLVGMPEEGEPLYDQMDSATISSWGSDTATNVAAINTPLATTSYTTSGITGSMLVFGTMNTTVVYQSVGNVNSSSIRQVFHSTNTNCEFFHVNGRVVNKDFDDPLNAGSAYSGTGISLAYAATSLRVCIKDVEVHDTRVATSNSTHSAYYFNNTFYAEVVNVYGICTSNVTSGTTFFLRVSSTTTANTHSEVVIQNLKVDSILGTSSTSTVVSALSCFGFDNVYTDGVEFNIALAYNLTAGFYTQPLSVGPNIQINRDGALGQSCFRVSGIKADVGRYPKLRNASSYCVFINDVSAATENSAGDYVRGIELTYADAFGAAAAPLHGLGCHIRAGTQCRVNDLDIKWNETWHGPAAQFLSNNGNGYVVQGNINVQGSVWLDQISYAAFDSITSNIPDLYAIFNDQSTAYVESLVLQPGRTVAAVRNEDASTTVVRDCNIDMIGEIQWIGTPLNKGQISVTNNNGIADNFYANNFYSDVRSWSVGRTGGSATSLRVEGLVANPMTPDRAIKIPNPPFGGMTLTPGAIGTRRLTLYVAVKNTWSSDFVALNNLTFYADVPYDDGGIIRYRRRTTRATGNVSADTSVWTGDTGITSYKLTLEVDVTTVAEDILIGIESLGFESGAYFYIDPTVTDAPA